MAAITGKAASAYVPPGLLLQWHITERCNLRCTHCYQDSYAGSDIGFADLLGILNQYTALLQSWREESRRPIRGHITITGGEPFARGDFLQLLEVCAGWRQHFSFAILTNGSYIDAAMAQRLRGLGPAFVQLSIEGGQVIHDRIRGPETFERTVAAIRRLVRQGLTTLISFTAHRDNFREFAAVARLGRQLGVRRVWADRLIPCQTGAGPGPQTLTPEETREFLTIMAQAQRETAGSWFGRTEIAMHRALQFLLAGGRPYQCTAGNTLIAVAPNGDLYPCRRLPVPVGNLLQTSLRDLYYQSNLFCELRNQDTVSAGCEECAYARLCRGGLKCLAGALTGDPFRADPGCWLAKHGTVFTV